MRRLLVLSCLLLTPYAADAQFARPATTTGSYMPPIPPPRVSPYLGLLNGGNPASNYYLLVQPQVRRFSDPNYYGGPFTGGSVPQLDPRLTPEAADLTAIPVQPQSGHPAGFGLTSPYYQFPSRQRSFVPFGSQTPAPLPPAKTKTPGGGI